VENTGTEEFLNAFRKFVARRGLCSTIYSDNAKGFKAASKEIRQLYKSINWPKVKQDGLTQNIEWFFSAEKSPHQNGLCERLVKTCREPLRTAIGSARLTKNQLAVILVEIEGIVNNRPLCVVSDDTEDFLPITPMELVNGRKLEQLPDPNVRNNVTKFQHLWKRRQAILNMFWRKWHHQYLLEQRVRKRWPTISNEELLGRLVLIKDDFLSRNQWRIGRIIQLLPSKDGLVRNVIVKTQHSTLKRAVQKLALFENY
jgi:hypothetical protein